MTAVKDVFWDSLLSLLAIPKCDYATLCRDIQDNWDHFRYMIEDRDEPGRRFLTLAWISVKAAAKDTHHSSDGVPWLARLALEGTVARGNEVAVPAFGREDTDVRLQDVFIQREGFEVKFSAFLLSNWDPSSASLCILKIMPRSMVYSIFNQHSMQYSSIVDSFGELIVKAIERVQADIRRGQGGQGIEHIWMWTHPYSGVGQHSRISSIPELLGFSSRQLYLERYPELDQVNLFVPPIEERDGVEVYVTGLRDLLSMLRGARKISRPR